jgi:hypothetical protein
MQRKLPRSFFIFFIVLILLLPWSAVRSEEIPLESCDRLLVAQVRVSGTKFTFLVDTAAVSILNLATFAHGEPSRAAVKSWNGTVETNSQNVVVGDLGIGRYHFRNRQFTAVDLSAIGRGCGRRIDGILGIDLLSQMGAMVDVKKRTVHLPDTDGDSKQAAEFEQQLAACQQSFNRADEAAFADCLDPQVVLFAVGGDYHGREAAMEYYRNRYFTQNPPVQVTLTPRAHHAIGDATIWLEYDLRVNESGHVIAARGTALYQKEDGRWRILNMNHSAPPPEPSQAVEHEARPQGDGSKGGASQP